MKTVYTDDWCIVCNGNVYTYLHKRCSGIVYTITYHWDKIVLHIISDHVFNSSNIKTFEYWYKVCIGDIGAIATTIMEGDYVEEKTVG